MKKYLYIILFLIICTPSAKAQTPFDFIYHAIPVSISFDIVEEIKQISGNLQTTISQAKKIIMTFKTDLSSIQSAITSTFNKIKSGAILGILGNPGQAQPGFCGKDISKTKPSVIAKKIKDILFVAKSDNFSYLTAQKAFREKFFMDNAYAIYAASLIVQQELVNDVKAQIDKAKSCAEGKGGECGIPASDDGGNNEAIFTYGKTLEAMDSVVRLWESVAALKARLAAVKVMRKIDPAIDYSTKDKQTFLNNHEAVAKLRNSVQIGFAQLNVKSAIEKLKNTSMDDVTAAVTKKENEAKQFVSSAIEFVSPDMNEKENAMAALDDEMNALGEMNEAETMVSKALEVHNIIKDLPQYKEKAEQYLKMKKDYELSLRKLKDSEACAIKYLGNYYKNPRKVWSGNLPEDSINNHDMRKGISGWALEAFEVLKAGEATDAINAFEVAEEKQKESKSEEDDAYLTDPDALTKKLNQQMSTSGTQPDEIAQDSLTDEEVANQSEEPGFDDMDRVTGAMGGGDSNSEDEDSDEDDDDSDQQGTETEEAEDPWLAEERKKNDDIVKSSMSSGKKDEADSESRKASMLSWQIGSEAAKLLSETADKWGGQKTNKRLIWNDTKKFYDIYLKKKYNNISRYMKSYSEADLLDLIAKKLEGNSQKANDSEYQANRKAALSELAKKSEGKLLDSIKDKLNLRNSFKDSVVAKIEKEVADLKAKANELNEELRAKKEEINAIKANESDKAVDLMMSTLVPEIKFPVGNEVPEDTKVAALDKDSVALSMRKSSSDNLKNNKEIKSLETEIEKLQAELVDIENKITKKDEELNQKRLDQQNKMAPADDAEDSLSEEELLENEISGTDGAGGALGELQAAAKMSSIDIIKTILTKSNEENPIEGFNLDSAMNDIQSGALNVIKQLQKKVEKIVIEETLASLKNLGEDLYLSTSHNKIVKIHNDMIDKLKALKFTFTVAKGVGSPIMAINDLAVLSDFLENMDVSPEEEGFFIGSTPKERDMRAPFKLRGFDAPPVREIFHFDAVDFKNVQALQKEGNEKEVGSDWIEKILASKDGKRARFVDKNDFLEYGGDVPLIWRHILKDFPFIESRLSLSEILGPKGSKCENITFARGGVLPCLYNVGNSKYVLDINVEEKEIKIFGRTFLNTKNKFINRPATSSDLSTLRECSLLIKNKGKRAFHTFWEIKLAKSNKDDDKINLNCNYSELGMLFEADKHNNLYLRTIPFKNFNRVNKKENKAIKKMLKSTRRNLAAAKYSELNRNQIGDFLKHVEREKSAKESMDEAKAEYDKSMETIYELLKEGGFTPSENFFFGNQADYEKAETILRRTKDLRIKEAKSMLGGIKIFNNNPAQEKNNNLNILLGFMKTDEKCLVKLSLVDSDIKDFVSRLAKAVADNALRIKLRDRVDKMTAEDLEDVYCAIY